MLKRSIIIISAIGLTLGSVPITFAIVAEKNGAKWLFTAKGFN